MNRFNRKLNNKGVSLLLVIITMTIVSVLAAIILALTYRNLKNMQDSIQSANSFYSAETAMDEMRAKFYEWSDQSLRVSYERWVQSYNTIPADRKEIVYKQKFVEELEKKLNDEFIDKYFGPSGGNIEDLFESFSSDRVSWNAGVTPSLTKLEDNTKMKVNNISLRYVDKAGYETIITTDIDLEVRYAGFSTNVIESSNENCAYYSVITDSQLLATGGTTDTVTVDGNIYAGGYDYATSEYSKPGIVFDKCNLKIYADKIVSKNNLEFTNGADLIAKGIDARYDYTGDLSLCNIWAAGLGMTGSGSSSMNIQGNCYIFDDTTLDAVGSEFNVVGSYYGYNTSNASDKLVDADNISLNMGTPKGSSCIVINGADSKVNLTQCDPLWIAGKSFVSVPENYGAGVSDANVSFPQGESISYRGAQSAYLIPGDCIAGIGHNPMTESEYLKLKNEDDTSVFFDIDRSRRNGGVNLTNYLNIDNPYRVATVNYGTGTSTSKLVYLYANFISTEHATDYFNEFYGKHDDLVDSKVAMLGSGNILFNPLTLVTTGNVISYNPEVTNKTQIYENTDEVVAERIETMESDLNEKYTGLTTVLDEDYTGVGVSQFLSESFVDYSKVADEYKVQALDYRGLNGQNYNLITGKDIAIESNTNAIVIAKGTVTIKNGAKVNGLIVSHDNVIIENGIGTFIAEPEEVSDLILYNEKVAPYFMLDAEGGSGDDEDGTYSSDLFIINYDNWKKN